MRYTDILARTHAELEAKFLGKPTPPDVIASGAVSEASSKVSETGTVQTGLAGEGTSSGVSQTGDVDVERHLRFARSLATWPPFPDTLDALTRLSEHYKLCVLSNVDHELFAHTRRVLEGEPGAKRFEFTAAYTAQDAGAYKPDPQALQYALRRLEEEHGIRKEAVLVVAQSVIHDLVPAKREGVKTVRINRAGASMGVQNVAEKFDWEFSTLGEMADVVEKEE